MSLLQAMFVVSKGYFLKPDGVFFVTLPITKVSQFKNSQIPVSKVSAIKPQGMAGSS
jgi:hypothetical protein